MTQVKQAQPSESSHTKHLDAFRAKKVFTQDTFCAKQFVHQAPFTHNFFYTTPCAPNTFCAKQLLHQTPFTPNTFCTKQFSPGAFHAK